MAAEQLPSRTTNFKKGKLQEHAFSEEINVLVAAFAVFDGFIDQNPAWSSAISLPPTLIVNAAHPSRIRIVVNPVPVRVYYDAVDEFVNEVLPDGEQCKYQLVLYLAVSPGGTGYWLERRARRTGYDKVDIANKLPSQQAKDAMKGSPLILETSIRFEDVFKRWKGQLPNADLHISNDAGLYLCEYLFYGSMAQLYRQSNHSLMWQNRTTVACLRVPKEVEDGKNVVTALIYALIDSRRQRNGDFDEPEPEASTELN